MKRAALLAFSRRGRDKAKEIAAGLGARGWDCRIFVSKAYLDGDCGPVTGGIAAFTGSLVGENDALVFVGACGIAVRAIAPWIRSKTVDPAVVCVDELGRCAIALLSGHIGGGNRLTREIAADIGAEPVITTATDVNGRFAVDAWAAEQGYRIGSMAAAKRFAAAILERDLPFCADAPVSGALPAGLFAGETGELGVLVSPRLRKPFHDTLQLLPPVLVLGLGCRRGTPRETIAAAAREVLAENGLDFRAVGSAASVTLKADEPGLLEFGKRDSIPLSFYTPEELAAVPGSFTASAFVRETVGVDNVCERSAVLGGGRLLVPKTARNGVTVAVAEKPWEVRFG